MLCDPALVLVDLQRDFCRLPPSADADQEAVDKTLERIAEFLRRYRATGRTPILVRTTHDEHSNSRVWAAKYEGRNRPIPCRTGTEGAEFADAIPVNPSDVVVTKHRYSAFTGTDLETYLSSNDITRLLVGGVNTNVCVLATVTGAFDRDYDVTVLEDCVATGEPAQQEPTLRNIESNFGTVRHSDRVNL